MALVTRAEVKAALGITSTDYDDQIDALLDPVSDLIELEAGRQFESASRTERHRGGSATIALREFPVSSITSVTDKVTGEALASDEYAVETTTGLLRRLPIGSEWSRSGTGEIVHLTEESNALRWEIVYVGGATSVPNDIKLAAYQTIGGWINSLDKGGGELISEKDGDYAYTKAPSSSSLGLSALPSGALAICRRYQQGVFV